MVLLLNDKSDDFVIEYWSPNYLVLIVLYQNLCQLFNYMILLRKNSLIAFAR